MIGGSISSNEVVNSIISDESEYCHFKVTNQNGNFVFSFKHSIPIAVLNEKASQALRITADLESIEFRAYCSVESFGLATKDSETAKKDLFIPININICGDKNLADVGKNLNAAQIFLQHPDCTETDIGYENPHVVTIPGLKPSLDASSKTRSELSAPDATQSSRESEKLVVKNEIALVFSSLSRSRGLKLVDADGRIKMPLLQYVITHV